MKIAVLVSAEAEWRAVREILPELKTSAYPYGEYGEVKLGELEVTLFQGGWGKISAAASAQYVIDHFAPDLLVNLGTCGGLRGRTQRGEIILAESTVVYDILEQMGDADEARQHYQTDLDLGWLEGYKGFEMAERGIEVRRGRLASADRDLLPADVARLAEDYGALAADWESGAIAWAARRNGVRCLILRGVTDVVGEDGDEVYGDYALFEARAREIMGRLLDLLPQVLASRKQ